MLLRDSLLAKIEERFGKSEHVTSFAIATVLDPRFKKLHFNDPLAYSKAIKKISTCIFELTCNERDKENVESNNIHLEQNANINDLWSFYKTLVQSVKMDMLDMRVMRCRLI